MGALKRKWRLLKQASLSKKRKDSLGPYARAVLFATKNGSFLAPVDDIEIGKKIGEKGAYDLRELNEIEQMLDHSFVVYVIGTHIGLLLVPIAKKVKMVVGYEANPQTYELLQMNIGLNKLENVKLFNYAAGDKDGEVQFYRNFANSGGSKIKPKKDQFIYNFDEPETITVGMKAVDQHVKSEGLPQADMIIMDIEGAEYLALKGMQGCLAASNSLYIEFIPHHLQNVADVSSTEFFNQILPHYSAARFMKQPQVVYNLKSDSSSFIATVVTMMENQKDDNILFYKD